MKIDIQLCSGSSNLLARADVTGKTMKLYGFSLFKKKDGTGFFVSSPSRKAGERWVPVVEITNKAVKESIESAIIKAYQEAAKAPKPGDSSSEDDFGGWQT